eukprot:gene5779-8843_t
MSLSHFGAVMRVTTTPTAVLSCIVHSGMNGAPHCAC